MPECKLLTATAARSPRAASLRLHKLRLLLMLLCLSGGASLANAGGPEMSCCTDLDARVNELSGAIPRASGLEIEVSGQIHRSVLLWSDDSERNAYVVDPASGGSYFMFSGDAELRANWSLGYVLEIETQTNSSDELSQSVTSSEGVPGLGASNFFIEHDEIGRVTVGKQIETQDHFSAFDHSGTDHFASPAVTDWNGSFLLRRADKRAIPDDALTWSLLGADDIGDGEVASVVRFDTSDAHKWQASISWGMGGVGTSALRYHDDAEDFAVSGGLVFAYYAEDARSPCRDGDALAGCGTLAGSLFLKHKPSAIVANLAFGLAAIDPTASSGGSYWHYTQIARAAELNSLGDTTTYAEFFHGERNLQLDLFDFQAGASGRADIAARTNVYGFGVMQRLDSLAMDFYVAFRHYENDLEIAAPQAFSVPMEDFNAILTGARVTF